MKKNSTPIFTPEQIDFVLQLLAERDLDIYSRHEDFVAEQVKKGYRNVFLNIARKQGYAV